MGEFLKGSRRKTGLLTLILALVFTSQWLSSILPPPSLQFRLLFDRDTYKVATAFSHTNHTIDRLSSKKSSIVWETFHAEGPMLVSNDSIGLWINATDANMPNLGNDEEVWIWNWRWCGFAVGEYHLDRPFAFSVTTWRIPYWSVTIPLTLISLWLLLPSKPRKSPEKKPDEPVPVEGS